MDYTSLRIENQLCFPVYAASRLIIRQYESHLFKLGITYPQYLVLMVLWEEDNLPVKAISGKLVLNTNTLTPLLKRMEAQGLISRQRSVSDARNVMVSLRERGWELREKALEIQHQVSARFIEIARDKQWLASLKLELDKLVKVLNYP